jgi:hypothetical protein
MSSNIRETFELELANAQKARLSGNEGRARVCARRAAGIVLGDFLERQGISLEKSSVVEKLKTALSIDSLPGDVRQVLKHFLIHVDSDHKLPVDVDLIEDAHWLAQKLNMHTWVKEDQINPE